MKGWMYYFKFVLRYWKLYLLSILLGYGSSLLGVVNPYLVKLIVDKAFFNRNLKYFLVIIIIGGLIFFLDALFRCLSRYFSRKINSNVNFDMTRSLFIHLQTLSMNFYNRGSTGEYIYRLTSDIRRLSEFICTVLPQISNVIVRSLLIFMVVLHLDKRLALLSIFLIPITYIHPYLFGRWIRELLRRSINVAQTILKSLGEIFSHIYLIKAMGTEKYEIRRFEKKLKDRLLVELQNIKLLQFSSFSNSIIQRTVTGIIAIYGGYNVIRGNISLGSLSAIMIYLTQLVGLLKSLGSIYQSTLVNAVIRDRLSEIIFRKPEICEQKNALAYRIKTGRIEFRNVYFEYVPNKPVLKNISFIIEPASKIALIGPSGCGKTTIISLILGLYKPQMGEILIDGLDIDKIKMSIIRPQIGVVLQEPFLWNDTVLNNILYGSEGAGRADAIGSAELVGLHHFILSLPDGYDTVIGESGCMFSEGQKQRVAIARAITRRPKILIFDEALSSIDSEAEATIIANIKAKFVDSTFILVSHRASAIQQMDLIYQLQSPSEFHLIQAQSALAIK